MGRTRRKLTRLRVRGDANLQSSTRTPASATRNRDSTSEGSQMQDHHAAPAVNRRTLKVGELAERGVVPLVFVGLIILFSVLKPEAFFTVANLQSVLTTQAVLLVVALSLTVVLAAGDLDLSIAGVISITSILLAKLIGDGMAEPVALLVSLGVALLVGLVNAALIVRVNVNPLIMTLAMGTLLTGCASAISNSATLALPSGHITTFLNLRFLGIGTPFWLSVGLLVVLLYVLQWMPAGRAIYFTGEGRDAARLIGVRVTKIRVLALVASAVGAWCGGVILVGQTGAAQAGLGDPYLLPAYASAFLGAASIIPGRFNPIGTYVGALLLAVGTTGLQIMGLQTWVTQVFTGAILIAAVTAAAVLAAMRRRAR